MNNPSEVRWRRMCMAIAQHDVKCRHVQCLQPNTTSPPLTNARAHILGKALIGNPYITRIELNISNLRCSTTEDNESTTAAITTTSSSTRHDHYAPLLTLQRRSRRFSSRNNNNNNNNNSHHEGSNNNSISSSSSRTALLLLLEYIATGPVLQHVTLDGEWNIASSSSLNPSMADQWLVVRRFLDAIATNTNITSLQLVNLPIHPDTEALPILLSILSPTTAAANSDSTTTNTSSIVRPTQHHNKNHRSLQRFILRNCDFYTDVACQLVAQAICHQAVVVHGTTGSSNQAKPPTLETLSIQSKSKSLLTERVLWQLASSSTPVRYGVERSSCCSSLRELILDSQLNPLTVSHATALAQTIRNCWPSLQHLSLSYYEFADVTLFQPIVEAFIMDTTSTTTAAFHHNDSDNHRRQKPLRHHKLSLHYCRFGPQSSWFMSYLLSQVQFTELHLGDMNRFTYHASCHLCAPMLQPTPSALHLPADARHENDPTKNTSERHDNNGETRILDHSEQELNISNNGLPPPPTIIQIQFLNMSTIRDRSTFHAVCSNLRGKISDNSGHHSGEVISSRHVRVQRWHYGTIPPESVETLMQCIRGVVYLQELSIALIHEPVLVDGQLVAYDDDARWMVPRQQLVNAIRTNGSLLDVKVYAGPDVHRRKSYFTADLQDRVDVYCRRNRNLPILLAQYSTRSGSCCTEKDSSLQHDVDATTGPHIATDGLEQELVLLPKLLLVAKHTPEMTPNHILMGLLSFGPTLGMQLS